MNFFRTKDTTDTTGTTIWKPGLILNFTPPHAITFTKCTTYLLCAFFAFSHNLWTKSTFKRVWSCFEKFC